MHRFGFGTDSRCAASGSQGSEPRDGVRPYPDVRPSIVSPHHGAIEPPFAPDENLSDVVARTDQSSCTRTRLHAIVWFHAIMPSSLKRTIALASSKERATIWTTLTIW